MRSALDEGHAAAGFTVLLDQSESTSQRPAIAERRKETLKLMLERGMKRIFLVVPGAVVGMQSSRIAHDVGVPSEMFVTCRTREDALDALREFDDAGT